MKPRVIPLTPKHKIIKKKHIKEIPKYKQIGDDAFDFIKLGGGGKNNFMDVGLDLSGVANVGIGGDGMGFEGFMKKPRGEDYTDFMSYLEPKTPKAAHPYGKESKKDRAQRFVGQDYETLYGLESVGISLGHSEKNITLAGRKTYKSIGVPERTIPKKIKEFRKVEEGSLWDIGRKKLRERKLKKELLKRAEVRDDRSMRSIGKEDLMSDPNITIRDTSGSKFSGETREKYR